MIRKMNNENNIALYEAECHGSIHMVEILSRKDPDYLYSANNYGKMPLYMATKKGCLEMVDVLLSTYTFMSHGSPSGKTALHAATREYILMRIL